MLNQLVSEKVKKENIDYFEVSKKYDLKSLVENREASDQVLNAIDVFEKIAGSIETVIE